MLRSTGAKTAKLLGSRAILDALPGLGQATQKLPVAFSLHDGLLTQSKNHLPSPYDPLLVGRNLLRYRAMLLKGLGFSVRTSRKSLLLTTILTLTFIALQHRSFASQPAIDTSQSDTAEMVLPHPGLQAESATKLSSADASYMLMHPVYSADYVLSIEPKHRKPTRIHDYTGYYAVQLLRKSFDLVTGYGDSMTKDKWLTRFLFLETVAGVPGFVAAMLRHMKSLRTMKRDNGEQSCFFLIYNSNRDHNFVPRVLGVFSIDQHFGTTNYPQ